MDRREQNLKGEQQRKKSKKTQGKIGKGMESERRTVEKNDVKEKVSSPTMT